MDTKDLTENVTELQFDVIGRIVPGAVVVCAYTWHMKLDTSAFSILSIGLITSYVIGFVLELVVMKFFIWPVSDPVLRWYRKKNPKCRLLYDHGMWDVVRSKPAEHQRVFVKRIAEKTMFRSLTFASLLGFALPPVSLRPHLWWLLVAAGVFSLCYWVQIRALSYDLTVSDIPPRP